MPEPTSAGESPARLFVALDLPAVWKETLGEIIASLQSSEIAPVRWMRAEGIHLTIKFLGKVSPTQIAVITSSLADHDQLALPLAVRMGKLGTFGEASRTSVVWMGIQGDLGPLAILAAQVDALFGILGFAAEKRQFRPHLTLGRVLDPATPDERRRLHERVASFDTPTLPQARFERIHLMRSHLLPGGAIYEVIARFPTT